MAPQRHYPDMARALLYERQDGACPSCGKALLTEQLWEIHHADGNPYNNDATNLELRHKGCHPIPGRPEKSIPPVYVYVCEQADEDPHTVERRLAAGYADAAATPQMRAGAVAKPKFRSWLLARLDSASTISMREAIAAGAELTGMDISTVERWLIPMASPIGPLDKYNESGEWMLRLKSPRATGTNGFHPHSQENGRTSDGPPARRRPPPGARGDGSPAPRVNGSPGHGEGGYG